jgi:hypothetical protein
MTDRLLDVAAAAFAIVSPIAWVVFVLAVAAVLSIALTIRSFGRDLGVPVPPIVVALEPVTDPATTSHDCYCGNPLTDGWDAHIAWVGVTGGNPDRHWRVGAWPGLADGAQR